MLMILWVVRLFGGNVKVVKLNIWHGRRWMTVVKLGHFRRSSQPVTGWGLGPCVLASQPSSITQPQSHSPTLRYPTLPLPLGGGGWWGCAWSLTGNGSASRLRVLVCKRWVFEAVLLARLCAST